jgi:hypothetical protein
MLVEHIRGGLNQDRCHQHGHKKHRVQMSSSSPRQRTPDQDRNERSRQSVRTK